MVDPAENDRIEKILSKFNLVDAEQLRAEAIQGRSWLVEDLIEQGTLNFFFGDRSSYKSFTAMSLAYSVAQGIPFLDRFPTTRSNVIYIDYENGKTEINRRLNLFSKEPRPDALKFAIHPTQRLDEGGIVALAFLIEKFPRPLIVIDTLMRGTEIDEDRAVDVGRFMTGLKRLAITQGATFVLQHHARKKKMDFRWGREATDSQVYEMRGSSELENVADSIISFKRKGDDKVTITQIKNRLGPEFEPFDFRIIEKEGSLSLVYGEKAEEAAANAIETLIPVGSLKKFKRETVMEPLKGLGYSESSIKRGLELLVKRGRLAKEGHGQYTLQLGQNGSGPAPPPYSSDPTLPVNENSTSKNQVNEKGSEGSLIYNKGSADPKEMRK